MKWWSKCISMAIAKTASRNVAFKVAKMREAIMEGQDELLMRNSGQTEGGLEANNASFLEDVCSTKRGFVHCQSRRQYANLGVYFPFGCI